MLSVQSIMSCGVIGSHILGNLIISYSGIYDVLGMVLRLLAVGDFCEWKSAYNSMVKICINIKFPQLTIV